MTRKNKMMDVYHCSFCGKSGDEVNKIIAGPDVFICDECVDGDTLEVQSIQSTGRRQTVYNIEVEGLHNYHVATETGTWVLVHNNGCGSSADGGADIQFFRGAKGADAPSFSPRPTEFKVDSQTGLVRDTHGVSVFDNPESVTKNGFTPHEVNQGTIPEELRIIQRGRDPHHYEITPSPGADLTPDQFRELLSRIECYQ